MPTEEIPAIDYKERARELFDEQRQSIFLRTDHIFRFLFTAQWVAACACALMLSPIAEVGLNEAICIHFLEALIEGGLISAVPLFLIKTQPGTVLTRHVVAVAQMLYSVLFIHLTGGRTATHFHIFGSLAVLAFYRDWRLLVSASLAIVLEQFVDSMYSPQAVFGVAYASPWRTFEHAVWIAFEDGFLCKGILQSVDEMKEIANRQAKLEAINVSIERTVSQKTQELIKREQAAQRYADIARQSEDAIIEVANDEHYTILSLNHGGEKLYKCHSEEVVGQSIYVITPKRLQAVLNTIFQRILSGEAIEGLEGKALIIDGTEVPVNMTMSPIRDDDGKIQRLSVFLRDMTQKRLVDQRIKEFYSTVSHELRTPLTSIRGALALLADGVVEQGSDDAIELIKLARESCVRLVRLVDDILDLRKIEEGKLELHINPFRSGDLVAGAIQTMQGLAEEKRIRLKANSVVNIEVEVDVDRIIQVLSNFLSNAIKYSPPHGTVELMVEHKPGTVRFTVFDDGPGIPLELQHKLFGKFQQIDSSDTRSKEGTGLGLAISKAIIEQHHGHISFHSEPGARTAFWFELDHRESLNTAPNAVCAPAQEQCDEQPTSANR